MPRLRSVSPCQAQLAPRSGAGVLMRVCYKTLKFGKMWKKNLQHTFRWTTRRWASRAWAHNAVIWGILIKHGSRLKKAWEVQITKLLGDIQALELQHKRTQEHSAGNNLANLRRQITDLLCFKANAAIQSGRKVTYELGDKCSTLLVGKLKERSSTSYMPLSQ